MKLLVVGLALGLGGAAYCAHAVAQTMPQPTPSRGALLYGNHCIACHSTQIHWRDQRLVTDWSSLVAQVRRWQRTAELGWSEADITEVARHLNTTVYKLAPTGRQLGAVPGAASSGDAARG